jgi:NitT/TauT family transport system substrate-binding protein
VQTKRITSAVVAAAVVAGGSVAALSATASAKSAHTAASMPTVTLMVGGWDKQIYMEYKLAADLGYYKKYGVNVTLSTEQQGGVGAETAMVSGQVDMAGAWYVHAPEFQVAGKPVEDVVNLGVAPGEREMCSTSSGIHSWSQVKGKTLGVTDLGSGTDGLTKYLSVKGGVPVADIHRLAVGAGPTAVAALQQGSAQCVMTTQPTVEQLEIKHIAYSMSNLASGVSATKLLGGAYPAAGVLVRTAWANAHKTAVQDVVDALVATLKFMNTHSAAQIAAKMPAAFVTEGVTRAQYILSLAADKGQFAPNGLMTSTMANVAIRIDRTAGGITPSQHVDVAETYTNSYVQAADTLEGISAK